MANDVLRRCEGPKEPGDECCNDRDRAFCRLLFGEQWEDALGWHWQARPYTEELCLEALKYARMEGLFPPRDKCYP